LIDRQRLRPGEFLILGEAGIEFGIDTQIIGRCEASEEKKLTLVTAEGSFEY